MPLASTKLFGWQPHEGVGNNPDAVQTSAAGNDSSAHSKEATPELFHAFHADKSTSDASNSDPPASHPSPHPQPRSYPSPPSRAPHPRSRKDPAWIPRPPNRFILFRCQFSKEHARDKSASGGAAAKSDKTLSARAAEAWQRLPASEKKRFQELAEQEKRAHARQYPEYRFHPVKRPAKTKRRALAAQGPKKVQLRRARRGGEAAELAPEIPSPSPPRSPLPASSEMSPKVDPDRRRSASVPLVNSPSLCSAQVSSSYAPKPDVRRSRSTMTRGSTEFQWEDLPFNIDNFLAQPQLQSHSDAASISFPSSSTYPDGSGFGFGPSYPPTPDLSFEEVSLLYTPDCVQSHDTVPFPDPISAKEQSTLGPGMSPLSAVASSLVGWGSHPTPAPKLDNSPPIWQPATPSAPPLTGADSQKAHARAPDAPLEYAEYSALDFPWGFTPFTRGDDSLPIHAVSTGQAMGDYAPSYNEEVERARALQEYNIGVRDRLAPSSSGFAAYEDTDAGSVLDFFDPANMFYPCPEY